eukprot:16059087-Heterocapsa_arctica.AAC.1
MAPRTRRRLACWSSAAASGPAVATLRRCKRAAPRTAFTAARKSAASYKSCTGTGKVRHTAAASS